MKNILFICFIVLFFVPSAMAAQGGTSGYSFNGDGTPTYPNSGVIWATAWINEPGYGTHAEESTYYNTLGNTINFYVSSDVSAYKVSSATNAKIRYKTAPSGSYSTICQAVPASGYLHTTCEHNISTTGNKIWAAIVTSLLTNPAEYADAHVRVTISTSPLYNVTGNTDCLQNVSLYYNEYKIQTNNTLMPDNAYRFIHLIDGETYTLIFSDGHEYEFTVDGADVEYNYDACSHTKYRFVELCDNLIPDSEGLFIENDGVIVLNIENFYEPSGILDICNSSADHIYIYTDTFIGKTGWTIDPVVPDTEYTLINPKISWSLKVIVQNESDGTLIDDAMVKVDQTCYCTSGYSTRQKMTVNGMVEFSDMSLQDASLFVMKSGYKICDENSTGYDVFLSGRTNFSSKTWIVKLAPSTSENVSTFYESGNKVDIHFRDVNGNRTSQILDTDAEVYLYYENNNSNEEAMTLKFQSSSTHTYFSDELSWSIAHDDIGHKTIANSYFTPWDYSYRAVIYNSSIYGWNITLPLTVRNATKETTLHYENLTTQIFFMGASDGKIDYREDMNIGIHACSNNTTLMYVDVELYKNNSLLCYKNLTASDFINADFQYWYVWNPIYEYVAGANYSIRMFGFDRTLLETDYIECVADEITRKNKLTILVKNRFGTNLDNAFIYLEGYGALSTGTNSYASYEGLGAGYYRYKATKAGYDASGWDDITISDSDEIVTYILTESTSTAGAANQPKKLDDDVLKNLYVMLLSFLLIFILFGGFLYVAK